METVYYEYGVADYTLPRRPGGGPGIARRRMRVEVVAAGATRTKIRFLEYHADGRGPGTVEIGRASCRERVFYSV